MTKTQSRVAVVATVAVGIIATGVLYATIPDAEGVIHACYARSGGTIRVIDDSVTQCKQGETSLAWNVKGVQGLPGIQGPPGPKGDTGDSQVFTVGTTEIGATESLAVPDLGTVTANCSGGRSLAQVDGAIPFDTTVVHNDGSASFSYNNTSWSDPIKYSQTVWIHNALAQWRVEYLQVDNPIGNTFCRVAVEVVRIG